MASLREIFENQVHSANNAFLGKKLEICIDSTGEIIPAKCTPYGVRLDITQDDENILYKTVVDIEHPDEKTVRIHLC